MEGEIVFLEKDSTLSWNVPFSDKCDFYSNMKNFMSSTFVEKKSQMLKSVMNNQGVWSTSNMLLLVFQRMVFGSFRYQRND